jgi:hypothetical protein
MKAVSASALASDGKPAVTDKAVKVLASAIFRQLQDEGCEPRHIISVSTQLLDLVTSALQQDSQ